MLIRRLVPVGVDTPTAPLHPEQVAAERAYPNDLGDSVTVRYRNHATGSGRETVHGLQRGIERLRAQQDVRPSRYPDALQSALVSESGRDFTENGAERDTATYLHDPRAVHWARHTEESGCAPTRTGTAAAVRSDHRRHGGEVFEVADHAGLRPQQPRFGRKQRLRPLGRLLALNRREKRPLLAAKEPASPTPDLHVEGKRRAQNPIAD